MLAIAAMSIGPDEADRNDTRRSSGPGLGAPIRGLVDAAIVSVPERGAPVALEDLARSRFGQGFLVGSQVDRAGHLVAGDKRSAVLDEAKTGQILTDRVS